MIDPISLTFLVGAIIGAVAVSYWDEIRQWLKETYTALKPQIKKSLKGFITLIEKTGYALINVAKYYSYILERKTWHETVITQEVDESKVPEHIKQKLYSGHAVDTTEDVAKELNLKLT